jgi:hypothetical protein
MDKNTIEGKSIDNCNNFNNITINIINVVILIIIITLLFIFALNIINYLLFTFYCLKDISDKYTTEDGTNTKLQDKYKHRLLNYVKNFDNEKKYSYNIKYDNNSSDLYIHNIIAYFNFIVKLLLFICALILIGVVYNLYNTIINSIHSFKCPKDIPLKCTSLLSEIYENNTYIYYLPIVIFLCIYVHSIIYTFLFNKMVYGSLYELYTKNYINVDTMVKQELHDLNVESNKTTLVLGEHSSFEYENTSKFTDQLMEFSLYKLDLRNFVISTTTPQAIIDSNFKKLIDAGLSYNLKFIIPESDYDDVNNINELLKIICNNKGYSKRDVDSPSFSELNLYVSQNKIIEKQIFIYLVYHLVISHNMEDPFIIHKLNNIFFNIFENIKKKYKEETKKKAVADTQPPSEQEATDAAAANLAEKAKLTADLAKATPEEKQNIQKRAENLKALETIKESDIDAKGEYDGDIIVEALCYDVKKMYREIICSYTIKSLLPENITKDYIDRELTKNGKLMIDYIIFYINKKNEEDIGYTLDDIKQAKLENQIKTFFVNEIKEKQLPALYTKFAYHFYNFVQEYDESLTISKIVYKLNLYLAIDMFHTAVFILLILIILYDLIINKYPSLKPQIINMINYIILIMNEVISAMFGLI